MGLLGALGHLLGIGGGGSSNLNSLMQTVNGLPQPGGTPYFPTPNEGAGGDMTPEPRMQNVPIADSAGPSAPARATAVPPHHSGGILGALGRVFMPQADSLWAGALRNGIFRAHESQDTYKAQTATQRAAAAETAYTTAREHKENADKDKYGEIKITPTGTVVAVKDGQVTPMYAPPEHQGETQKLIEMWIAAGKAGNAPLASLIERAIKGYQYTPEVISAQAAARTGTAVAGAEARARYGAQYRAPPRGRSGGSGGLSVPSGWTVVK